MGTTYYGACHDCRQRIDLDKFYSWSAYDPYDYRAALADRDNYADIEKENLDEFKNDGWIYRSLRLHFFLNRHNGHRVAVLTEHDPGIDDYADVYRWPSRGDGQHDEIDWTDPKAGRLIIKTSLGDIYLDRRHDGINCFRWPSGGDRVDTLLLPASKEGSV